MSKLSAPGENGDCGKPACRALGFRGLGIAACFLLSVAPARSALVPLPPLPPTPACVTQTLDNYIALGADGCGIGDKVFTSFSYTPPNGTEPTAKQITVAPITTAWNPGFAFTADPNWDAEGINSTFSLDYYVFVTTGGHPIKDASLAIMKQSTANRLYY